MRLHHRSDGYADGGYACADCEGGSKCAACLFYVHPSQHGAPGDPFDFPCSRTFRDFYSDPYGPVYRDQERDKLSPPSCETCYHWQEFHHCSCREGWDIYRGCPDWRTT